jgi:hypothetical protein
MSKTNAYCRALGIQVPRLEVARSRSDANYYSLLIVVLLERGEPITLEEAARRFAEAGIASPEDALASLKRCKPGRPPIYRDGDLYALDPHDDEADLWAFRLGRSAQRIACCVLDAHGAVMHPDDVVAFLVSRGLRCHISADSARYWRRGAPIRAREDGRWELDRGHPALRAARQAVRERVEMLRRWDGQRPDSAVLEAQRRHAERRRAAHAEQLARMRRVLVSAYPATKPEALVLVEVASREITTFLRGELAEVPERLAAYDLIAGESVRALLRSLAFEPGERRLSELGPPQKTRRLNRRGRKLQITTRLLVQGSCGISRPFGDERVLHGYLREGKDAKLRRRIAADAKSLFALYQYGRLHGAVRLRWGFLDEMLPAPWVHRDEPTLFDLMKRAHEEQVPLEVVVGGAPGWHDPWSRVQRAYVAKEPQGWRTWLVDEHRCRIPRADVQLARPAGS